MASLKDKSYPMVKNELYAFNTTSTKFDEL